MPIEKFYTFGENIIMSSTTSSLSYSGNSEEVRQHEPAHRPKRLHPAIFFKCLPAQHAPHVCILQSTKAPIMPPPVDYAIPFLRRVINRDLLSLSCVVDCDPSIPQHVREYFKYHLEAMESDLQSAFTHCSTESDEYKKLYATLTAVQMEQKALVEKEATMAQEQAKALKEYEEELRRYKVDYDALETSAQDHIAYLENCCIEWEREFQKQTESNQVAEAAALETIQKAAFLEEKIQEMKDQHTRINLQVVEKMHQLEHARVAIKRLSEDSRQVHEYSRQVFVRLEKHLKNVRKVSKQKSQLIVRLQHELNVLQRGPSPNAENRNPGSATLHPPSGDHVLTSDHSSSAGQGLLVKRETGNVWFDNEEHPFVLKHASNLRRR